MFLLILCVSSCINILFHIGLSIGKKCLSGNNIFRLLELYSHIHWTDRQVCGILPKNEREILPPNHVDHVSVFLGIFWFLQQRRALGCHTPNLAFLFSIALRSWDEVNEKQTHEAHVPATSAWVSIQTQDPMSNHKKVLYLYQELLWALKAP